MTVEAREQRALEVLVDGAPSGLGKARSGQGERELARPGPAVAHSKPVGEWFENYGDEVPHVPRSCRRPSLGRTCLRSFRVLAAAFLGRACCCIDGSARSRTVAPSRQPRR
jgi:hypothetical protein